MSRCSALIISADPDTGGERVQACKQEAVRDGRLCYLHTKYSDRLSEPEWTDDRYLGYDAGIIRVVDSETGGVYVRRANERI